MSEIKIAKLKNGRLYLDFRKMSYEKFISMVNFIKLIKGRKYNNKTWNIPNTDNNIKILKQFGFDIILSNSEDIGIHFRTKELLQINVYNAYLVLKSKDINFLHILQNEFREYDYSECYVAGRFNKSFKKPHDFLIKKSNKKETYGVLGIGFLNRLISTLEKNKAEYDVKDKRKILNKIFSSENISKCLHYLTLYDYQVEAVKKCLKQINGIIKIPTSGGKCLGKGTKIIMYDGSLKKVEKIILGDLLMGLDSNPKKVKSICKGIGDLYLITQNNGIDYIVNKDHVLSLFDINYLSYGKIVNISVKEYLTQNQNFIRHLRGYKALNIQFKKHIRKIPKKHLLSKIKIKYIGKGNYYGFELYGDDKRFLLKDFTVTHNTEIFLSLCKLLQLPTLILFSRVDLAKQTLKRAYKAGLDAGIVQGRNIDENHDIVIATIQSAKKLQNKYEMVIVDECHKSASEQYQNVLSRNDFLFRFGFSATPLVKDKLKRALVIKNFGEIIYTLPAGILMKNKKIATPTIKIININTPTTIYNKKWINAELLGIIENQKRNAHIYNIAVENKKVMVLVKKKKHGEILKSMLPGSEFICSDDKSDYRWNCVEKFNKNDNFILIASGIFDEGISIDSIENLVIAGGGKSFIINIQRLGRALRITENKKTVNVYDFMDSQNKILEKHSIERIEDYKNEGYMDVIYV